MLWKASMYEFSSGVATCINSCLISEIFLKVTHGMGYELAAVIIAQNDPFQFMTLVYSSEKRLLAELCQA
ncbi:hypothetical protein FHK02_2125 [Spirosoma sp. LMG 31448]|uniref:Uncharacterized protein n=1 Tax=Spirosoma utsteinense TaxID=2585773 RepID=A0ABR6W5P9_9BACT|nr:hypothetical protein [Spirosoma utsteinense]MBC3791807.1 hypothetical protein [Spirosoma utsteinense]